MDQLSNPLPDRQQTCPSPSGDASSFPPPSSLDPLQTSVNYDPADLIFESWSPEDDAHQQYCHGGWAVTRRRVRDSMLRTHQTADRVCRYQDCGKDCWVYQHKDDPTNIKVVANHCMDRMCITCGGLKALRVRNALAALMHEKKLRLCTLTLSGQSESLADLLDRLYRHFKALRQTELWTKAVDGGCAFLEVKWSAKANRWHPHLHLILEGRYLPQAELSNTWRALTKDSWIVDVRQINDSENASNYVTKYVTKPLNTSFSGNPDRLDEAVVAMKGRRLVFCFGSWYGTPLNAAEDTDLFDESTDPAVWTSVGSLSSVLARSRAGDEAAKHLLEYLESKTCLAPRRYADDG